MSYISEAHTPIVPKYRFHSNQAYMVIEDKWQAEDFCEPRYDPCHNSKTHQVYPISGNNYNISPTVCTVQDWVGLPEVPLPYVPPPNLKYPRIPAFENMVHGDPCSNIETCESKIRNPHVSGYANHRIRN